MSRSLIAQLTQVSLFAALLGVGCKREVEVTPTTTSQTPDRLAPGEAVLGTPRVFGLDIPDGLRVVARYAKNVHLSGPLPLAAVVEAIQGQLEPTLLELTPRRAVWERVVAKTDASRRLMRIEVTRDGPTTRVQITDVTAPKPVQGLSEAERWERAGRNPDGTVKDPSQML